MAVHSLVLVGMRVMLGHGSTQSELILSDIAAWTLHWTRVNLIVVSLCVVSLTPARSSTSRLTHSPMILDRWRKRRVCVSEAPRDFSSMVRQRLYWRLRVHPLDGSITTQILSLFARRSHQAAKLCWNSAARYLRRHLAIAQYMTGLHRSH